MTHSPLKTFRSKWLVQATPGLGAALGIPTDAWIDTPHPDDAEWRLIASIKDALGVPASTWDVIASSPFLRLFPQGNMSATGKVPEYKMQGTGINYEAGPIQRSFSVQLSTQVQGVYEGLRRIAGLSNYGNLAQQSPVLVLDFAWPEVEDIIIAKAQGYPPYTVRMGLIRNLNSSGPAGGYPGWEQFSGVGGQGISFEFVEAKLRRAA